MKIFWRNVFVPGRFRCISTQTRCTKFICEFVDLVAEIQISRDTRGVVNLFAGQETVIKAAFDGVDEEQQMAIVRLVFSANGFMAFPRLFKVCFAYIDPAQKFLRYTAANR